MGSNGVQWGPMGSWLLDPPRKYMFVKFVNYVSACRLPTKCSKESVAGNQNPLRRNQKPLWEIGTHFSGLYRGSIGKSKLGVFLLFS